MARKVRGDVVEQLHINAARTSKRGSGTSSGDPQRVAPLFSIGNLPALLYTFALRSDGWLRWMPSGDTKQLYLKWKFTSGRFAGHYCFVSGRPEQYEKLLDSLLQFIEECYADIRKPSKDHYYNA